MPSTGLKVLSWVMYIFAAIVLLFGILFLINALTFRGSIDGILGTLQMAGLVPNLGILNQALIAPVASGIAWLGILMFVVMAATSLLLFVASKLLQRSVRFEARLGALEQRLEQQS